MDGTTTAGKGFALREAIGSSLSMAGFSRGLREIRLARVNGDVCYRRVERPSYAAFCRRASVCDVAIGFAVRLERGLTQPKNQLARDLCLS
jgi:hypothetical protein